MNFKKKRRRFIRQLVLIITLLLSFPVLYAQHNELPKKDDCCHKLSIIVTVDASYDILNLKFNEYKISELPFEDRLKVKHSAIMLDDKIYDWGADSKRLWPEYVNFNRRQFDKNIRVYKWEIEVDNETAERMKFFWKVSYNPKSSLFKPFDLRENNCHIMVGKSLRVAMDDKNVENFHPDVTVTRYGMVGLKMAEDLLTSNCGPNKGLLSKASEIIPGTADNWPSRMEEEAPNEEVEPSGGEDCQCTPPEFNTCEELIRLDLASGPLGGQYVDLDLFFQTMSGIGFVETYKTTYSEVNVMEGYPELPMKHELAKDDGTLLEYFSVGGVNYNELPTAHATGKILAPGSYDIITISHPFPTELPSLNQISDFLKVGGEIRIAFFSFDYKQAHIANNFTEEFKALFDNVEIQHLEKLADQKPPSDTPGNVIISGRKRAGAKASSQRQAGLFDLENSVRVSPNPSNQFIKISFTTPINTGFTMELTNLFGARLKGNVYASEANNITIDVSDLHNGFYILTINDGREKVTKRIIVSR